MNCAKRSTHPFGAALVSALLLLSLPGCGQRKTTLQMGLQRIAIDLAFKTDPNAPPPAPKVIFEDLPPLPTPIQPLAALAPAAPTTTPPVPTRRSKPTDDPCPAPRSDAVPDRPVSLTIAQPPRPGRYEVMNRGKLTVTGPGVNRALPYPALTTMEIQHVVDTPAPPRPGGQPGARTLTFEVKQALASDYTLTRYSVTPTELAMLYRETKVGDKVAKFSPTPAITIVGLGSGEKSTWSSAGIDSANGTSGVVQGTILKREIVNVCGTVVDTYRVSSTERFTSLTGSSSYSSSTKDTSNAPNSTGPGQPNFYNVATQNGGIFVTVETHTTTTVAPYTIDIDNIGTITSPVPKAP